MSHKLSKYKVAFTFIALSASVIIGICTISFLQAHNTENDSINTNNAILPRKKKPKQVATTDDAQFIVKGDQVYRVEGTVEVPVKPHEASLSRDKKLLAYTLSKKESWDIEPYIYVYDLETHKTKKLNYPNSKEPVYVDSWSYDNANIFLMGISQSVGSTKGYLFNIKSKKVTASVELYTSDLVWAGNLIIYLAESGENSLLLRSLDSVSLTTNDIEMIQFEHEKEEVITDFDVIENEVKIEYYYTDESASFEDKKLNQIFINLND